MLAYCEGSKVGAKDGATSDFAAMLHVLSAQQYLPKAHSFVVAEEAHLHAAVIADVSLCVHAVVDVPPDFAAALHVLSTQQ